MTEPRPLPLVDRLRLLAAWEPELADPAFVAGHWAGGDRLADGSLTVPWFDYAPAVERMHLDASTGGWVVPFDWMGWTATPEAERLLGDPAAIAGATADDLQRILTAVFRGERFADGSIAGAIERGILLAVARRARVLADEADPADAAPAAEADAAAADHPATPSTDRVPDPASDQP